MGLISPASGRDTEMMVALGNSSKILGCSGCRKEWEEASGRVEGMLRDNLGTIITLQMRKGRVPLRFVRRGEERFNY